MAKKRTLSATEITEREEWALNVCRGISESFKELIRDIGEKDNFMKNYGRVHSSRDAGIGKAGGKLQRDALCTRGRTGKAPYSNRNFRWHPLIIAIDVPDYAEEVEEITIDNKSLVFIINGELWYPQDVHKLPKVYCASFDKWYDIKDELNQWEDDDWRNNSCVIPAMEYSSLEYSVETFAILGISIVSNFFEVRPLDAYMSTLRSFENNGWKLSSEYPKQVDIDNLVLCPLCLAQLYNYPANLNPPERSEVFQPPWRESKREEGEAESLQLFHTIALKEKKICHTPKLVRYGHRWCNVAVADHSLNETVDFMRAVVEAHERKNISES
jgi:hypothetical protein